MDEPLNIAIALPTWVGDVVMATPVLRAVRKHFANSRITHVGRTIALEVLAGDAAIADEQLPDISQQSPKLVNTIRQGWQLRSRKFDLAILLPNSFRSAMVFALGGAKRIAGYSRDGRGWLLSDKLQPPRSESGDATPIAIIDYYIGLANSLGVTVDSRELSLGVTSEGEAQAEQLLADAGTDESRPLVMLNPGASFGPSKLWPANRYAAVADALAGEYGAQIIINAAPGEKGIARQVAAAMQSKPAINFAEVPGNIALLKSLLRRCSLLITNDTGARHIAAAMGASVVTIFGSTDPKWSQIDYEHERIVRVEVPCSPCQQKVCAQPQGEQWHECMTAVTVEMVLDAARELLVIAEDAK